MNKDKRRKTSIGVIIHKKDFSSSAWTNYIDGVDRWIMERLQATSIPLVSSVLNDGVKEGILYRIYDSKTPNIIKFLWEKEI